MTIDGDQMVGLYPCGVDSERLIQYRPWLLGVSGLAVLLARQAAESHHSWRTLVLYACGAVAFGLAVVRNRRAEPRTAVAAGNAWPADTKRLLAAVGVLLVILWFMLDVFDVSGTAWILQASAGVALLGAAHLADKSEHGARTIPPAPSLPLEAPRNVVLAVLGAITLVGAWVRFRELASLPRGFWFDEADLAVFARRMSQQGERPVFTGPVPAYYSYLIAILTGIFGESIATVRAVSAIAGTLTIPAAYLAAREMYGRSAGLVVAAVIAFSRWAITLSRVGMNNVLVPLCAFVALGFALRGHRRSSHLDYAIAGMAAVSGMLFYPAMSATIIAIALIVVAITFASGRPWRSLGTKVVFVAVAGLIVFLPLAKLAITESDVYFSRTRETALWSERGLSDQDGVWSAFFNNVGEYFPMTHWEGDPNGRHNIPGRPMLSPLIAGLSAMGVGAALMRRDRWLAILLIAWFPLGYLPGLLSLPFEAPNSLRAVTILPLAALAATAAVALVARTFGSNRRAQIGLLGGVAVALALTGANEVRDYFDAQRNRSDVWAVHSTYETVTADEVGAAGPNDHIAAVAFLRGSKQQEFLYPERTFDAIFGTQQALPMHVPLGKDAVFYATGESFDIATQAEQLYPGAEIQRQFGPHPLDLLAVRVSAEDIDATRGWALGQGPDQVGVTDGSGASTNLVVDQPGTYRLRLVSPGELVVDGFNLGSCSNQGQLGLATGFHRIEVLGHDADTDPQVEWMPLGGAQWQPVAQDRLYRVAGTTGGLLTRHYDGEVIGDPSRPALSEITPALALRMHELARARPYTTVWSGGLQVPSPGEYVFIMNSDDETSVIIDGTEVVNVGAEGGRGEQVVALGDGVVPIEVTYIDRDGRSALNLSWLTPGALEPTTVPSSAFVPWLQTQPAICE